MWQHGRSERVLRTCNQPIGIKEAQMAPILTFSVQIVTGDRRDGGTDGRVYLGLWGREFYIESGDEDYDDWERGSSMTYIFGEGQNVMAPELNDPQSDYPIKSEDIALFPAYIRLDPIGKN